jgi:O-antigen chain-terminating methyltransferase
MIWGVEMEDQDNDKSVEKIMRLTMGNIRRRKEGERYDMMDVAAYRSSETPETPVPWRTESQIDLECLNSNWEIQNYSYVIRSHRRVIGKPLVRGRELIHGEVRRYVDPMIEDQNEFNSCVCRVLNEIANRIEEIYSGVSTQIDERISQIKTEFSLELDEKLSQSQIRLSTQIDERISQIKTEFSLELDEKLSQSQIRLSSEMSKKIFQSQINLSPEMCSRKNGEIHVEDIMHKLRENIKTEKTKGRMESENGLNLNEIANRIEEIYFGISTQIDEKILQVYTSFSSEVDEKISQSQIKLSSDIDEKISQSRIELSTELEKQLRTAIASMNQDKKDEL